MLGKIVLVLNTIGRVSQDHGDAAIRDLGKQVHTVHAVKFVAEHLHSALRSYFIGLRGHDTVQFGVFGESVHEGQNYVAIEQQPLALAGVGDIGKLVGADVELLGKDFPISRRLIEHINEVGVFQDIGDFRACQKVFAVLRDAGRDNNFM